MTENIEGDQDGRHVFHRQCQSHGDTGGKVEPPAGTAKCHNQNQDREVQEEHQGYVFLEVPAAYDIQGDHREQEGRQQGRFTPAENRLAEEVGHPDGE
jgi:hypothetical protein